MTALAKYLRLEATGLWRESRDASPREVVVAFGNATLTLKDLADAPLGHRALAAAGLPAAPVPPTAVVPIADRDRVALATVSEAAR